MVCLYHVYNSQSVRLLSMQTVSKAISSVNIFQNTKVIPYLEFWSGYNDGRVYTVIVGPFDLNEFRL